jgi:hypothetical protein
VRFPEWRAGRLSIGYHEERDLLLLEVEEVLDDGEEGDEEDEEAEGGAQPGDIIGVEPGVEDLAPDATGAYEGNGESNEGEEQDAIEEMEELESLTGESATAKEPHRVRLWATREQMLSLARHGAAVCAQGRPRCQLCGNPIDPEGHQCPALNGHRDVGEA